MRKLGITLVLALIGAAFIATAANAGSTKRLTAAPGRFILIAPNSSAYAKMAGSAKSEASGSLKVANTLAPLNALTVVAWPNEAQALANRFGAKLAPDGIKSLIRPEGAKDLSKVTPGSLAGRIAALGSRPSAVDQTAKDILAGFEPDPAFGYDGLMWSIERMNGPGAWDLNAGDDNVIVGVEDTGLDYTHSELADNIIGVYDFSTNEALWPGGPGICEFFTGYSDAFWASLFGTPQNLDYNGHGSWIGGNIAGLVNDNSVNGAAPGVSLVALKISQWCGSAFDSELLAGFIWAAEQGIDVVSISFGGYTDRSIPEQDQVWKLYRQTAKYAKARGTQIIASAGNDHVALDKNGKVTSHGPLTAPPGLDPGDDYKGLYETPAGVPGYLDISSTGNVVAPSSPFCDGGDDVWGAYPWCKPTTDMHQAAGSDQMNQLAYYSNYGPRTDFAGPGGARKFNLPVWDRGGTPGWPYTGLDSAQNQDGDDSSSEGYNAYEDFSITSNWALEIPCFIFDDSGATPGVEGYFGLPFQSGFDDDQCYSTIQGTSMATPHVSAAYALVASAFPGWRFDPDKIIKQLKNTAIKPKNYTPPLSKNDTSEAEYYEEDCPDGYCHLGGKEIKDKEAYGAGIPDLHAAVLGGETGT